MGAMTFQQKPLMRLATALLLVLGSILAAAAVPAAPAAAGFPTCNTWIFARRVPGSPWAAQVPSYNSNPGCVLNPGDTGQAVRILQLSLIYCNNADLSPAWIDGVYGRKTRDAVAWIQGASGITVDGSYGPQTREAMRWLFRNGAATSCARLAT